jgi:hypothetical protein
MPRFANPSFVSSLKDARYWSLDWVKEQNIAGPFHYVILLKQEGGYKVFGQYATATEAFDDRRLLCEEHGIRSFFLRAVRVVPIEDCEVVGPGHPESREDLDRFRDALATGDESLIASDELPAFRSWAARTIEQRLAYQRVDRDTPRSEAAHGEIPF